MDKSTWGQYQSDFTRAPLFWSAALFCAGIALGAKFDAGRVWLSVFLALSISAMALALATGSKKSPRPRKIIFALACPALAALGAFYYCAWLPRPGANAAAALELDAPVRIKLKVRKTSEFRQKYSRARCEMIWLDQGRGPENASGRLWLNYGDEKIFFPGDQLVAWARLRKIRGCKNPFVPDPALRFARSGIYFSATTVDEIPVFQVNPSHRRLLPLLHRFRQRVKSELDRSGARSSYLLSAMLLGEKDAVPEDVWRLFQATSCSHILVISGFNLSLVAGFCFLLVLGFFRVQPWLLKRLNPYPIAGLLTAFPITFYGMITGLEIPTFRALIMAWVLLLAIALRKTRELLNALGLAAMVILLLDPASLFDASFQLSFLAVFVLIPYFNPVWALGRGPRLQDEANLVREEKGFLVPRLRLFGIKLLIYFYGLLLATVLIQVFLAPLNAYFFSQASLTGPFCNLLLVPICGFWVYPIGITGLGLASFAPGLAEQLFVAAGFGAWLMERIAAAFASLTEINFMVRPPIAAEIFGWYLAMLAGLESIRFFAKKREPRKKILLRIAWLALLLALGLGLAAKGYHDLLQARGPSGPRISVIDVGLGQSILIELPQKKRILIDGGGKIGAINLGQAVVGRFLLERGIRRIDKVILTHPETDHSAGLEYILANFKVGEFLLPQKLNPAAQSLLEIARDRKTPTRFIDSSQPAIEIAGARLEFLNPPPELPQSVSLNDASAVIKMDWPGNTGPSVLFPGEISRKVERRMVEQYGAKLQSQILIAPHHGSKSSSSMEFLKAVAPEYILISAGPSSRLKLPSKEALARMKRAGARVLRTDQQGEIELELGIGNQ